MQIRKLIYTVAFLMVAGTLFGQEKVVDQSAKKAPSWLGLSEPGYIVTSAEMRHWMVPRPNVWPISVRV